MRTRVVVRGAVATLSLIALILLVRHVGVDAFADAFVRALPFVPALLLLEGVRIAADVLTLRALYGADAGRVPMGEWIRLHLEANAACVVLPGGRAVSEAMKVARLGPVLGRGRSAALIATQHSINMLTIATTGVIAAIAAGPSVLGAALFIHAAVTFAGAVALRASLLRAVLPKKLATLVGASPAILADLRATARTTSWFPAAAVAAKCVNRLAQVAQFALLLAAAGTSLSAVRSFLASGVSLLGGVLGELSLAQLGCTDGALALSAPMLSISVGSAVAIASLARFVQLTWSAVGSALCLAPRVNHGQS